MSDKRFVPYTFDRLSDEEMKRRALDHYREMDQRRSVRDFAPDPVPRELIETAILTASTAPSGAHRQPWKFVAVDNADLKHRIREGAEREEFEFYEGGRATEDWLRTLDPLGTDWHKPFLETAPWLVVVFEELFAEEDGGRKINYYTKESVGIACGLFIASIHRMGLATLTHTPSPMKFLNEILGRPRNERPYILFPVGYPAPGAEVPDLRRKSLGEISVWNPGSEITSNDD